LFLNIFVSILEFFSRIVDRIFSICCVLAFTLVNKFLNRISQKLIIKTNKKKFNCVETKVKEIYISILIFSKLKTNTIIISQANLVLNFEFIVLLTLIMKTRRNLKLIFANFTLNAIKYN